MSKNSVDFSEPQQKWGKSKPSETFPDWRKEVYHSSGGSCLKTRFYPLFWLLGSSIQQPSSPYIIVLTLITPTTDYSFCAIHRFAWVNHGLVFFFYHMTTQVPIGITHFGVRPNEIHNQVKDNTVRNWWDQDSSLKSSIPEL